MNQTDHSRISKGLAMATESSSSCCQNYETNNKGGAETRKKVMKLRSIKLVRLPSVRFAARQQAKIKSDSLSILSSNAESSLQPNLVEISDASPHYMKTTTSSNAKKDNLQKATRTLTRRSSFKPPKSLTRLPSAKFRRPLMRKSSGGSELKKKMRKFRSIRLRNQSSIVLPNHLKAAGSSDAENADFHSSFCDCGSSLSSNYAIKRSNLKQNLAAGNKSKRVITRTSSVRPLRTLSRMASLRTKRPSMKKSSQMTDTDIHRATCSSALKDSKFPNHLELQSGGSESEGTSNMKVCPYSYCSLHGHRHCTVHPLQRFVSMRRRMLKTQRSLKLESQSFDRAKRSSNPKKGISTSKMASNKDAADLGTAHKSRVLTSIRKNTGPKADLNGEGSRAGDGEGTSNSKSVADFMLGEQVQQFHSIVSSASICEHLEETCAASEEKNRDSMQDHQFMVPDSESNCNTDVVDKTEKEKQKHMGLWRLIYQHMASGIAAEDELQAPVTKMDKEEEDSSISPGTNKSGSSEFSGIDHSVTLDDHETESLRIQLYKRNAIRLVQEAFDKILSEIPDHSPDDQLSESCSTLDKEFSEKNHGEGGELSIAISSNSKKEGMLQEPEQMMLKADNVNGPEVEKTESEIWSKSNKQTPKSWSNLKKVLVLKRFVKALEQVRNFNRRKPWFLPMQTDPEAEKIHLRHQTVEERKNSEEWMLDYTLQQVIFTLAPAQKRKVALLVQAFESVTPLPNTGASPRSNLGASSHATPVQSCMGSTHQKGAATGKETNFLISLHKTSFPYMKPDEDQDQNNDSLTAEEQAPDSCSDPKEPTLEPSCIHIALSCQTNAACLKENFGVHNPDNGNQNSIIKDDQPDSINCCLVEVGKSNLSMASPKLTDTACTSNDVLVNGQVLQEVNPTSASEVNDLDLGFNDQQLASDYPINASGEPSDDPKNQNPESLVETTANKDADSSASVSELVKESSSKFTKGETMLRNKFFQLITPNEESKSGSTDLAYEKQKNMGLWYLIYKHMVSGSTTLLDEGAGTAAQGDDVNTSHRMDSPCSHQGSSLTSLDIDVDDYDAGSRKVELQQIEAIRMVEEAIDEIPLLDSQCDSADEHSITRDIIEDQKHLNKQPGGESENTEVEKNTTLDLKQPCENSEDTATAPDREKTVLAEGNKPKQQTQKSWSNLKKLILLRRFVKALEKVKKFNPREPRFLPLDHEKEAEKVLLRHQDVEDRKNADEWMLDYALQQVVAKLTPARKRKVQLLVEAFETVIPTIDS